MKINDFTINPQTTEDRLKNIKIYFDDSTIWLKTGKKMVGNKDHHIAIVALKWYIELNNKWMDRVIDLSNEIIGEK
jgi:hypothetical protein